MKSTLLSGLLALALSAQAAPTLIATISDPAGDDNGTGALVLPQRNDFEAGDLDLLQLRISRDDDGYWFEASFKNPVRDPANTIGTIGSEPLSNTARKGFYQFNIDVYIDQDRAKGSGNAFTLPGRKASIDPAFAWEKAVILTPRPEATRSQLLEVLERQFPDRPKGEAAASIDQSMFFPTQVRVRGKSVLFFVPLKFIGSADAKQWAVTAFVTAAKTDISVNLPLLPSTKSPLEQLDLGVMQPALGRPRDGVGYAGGAVPLPIVDLLAPGAMQQVRLLAADGALAGVPLDRTTPAAPDEADAKAVKPTTPAAPAWGDPPAAAQAAAGAAPRPAAGNATAPAAPGAAGQAVVPVPLQGLLQPGKRPETAAPAEPAAVSRLPIAKRLEALQQLLDQKVITPDEYKQQRQRILNEL